ncbi:MAG TPA: helicase-related protein, partial [Gemmatimonadaceae bacterium]|nr:helicase-related protein [Gemmatimonadaceae bacterium]
VAGGTISRSEAIGRFAPSANGHAPARHADAVTLLLTTDLLSEGVNLQDAGVVVHLDLPWTPARMDQRLGRIARIGSLHETVVSYALTPPIASRDIVRIEAILKRKMTEAGVVAAEFPSLNSWVTDPSSENAPQLTESARAILSQWLDPDRAMRSDSVVTAVVDADFDGFLAACGDSSQSLLVGCIGSVISEDPQVTLRLLRQCDGESSKARHSDIEDSLARLDAWLYSRDATSGIRVPPKASSSVRRSALRRVDRAVRAARPHERARTGAIARDARDILRGTIGHHMENEISRFCGECPSDRDFLEHVISILPRKRFPIAAVDDTMRVAAMIVLGRNDTVVSGKGTLT